MVNMNARIPLTLAEKIKIRAVRERRTIQELVAEALTEYLKKPIPRGEGEQ